MREPSASYLDSRSSYVPVEFQHDFDVAECALDVHLEQLQREYASALRAAAETRGARLMRAIGALEERLENE
jgi:hypothetical protein